MNWKRILAVGGGVTAIATVLLLNFKQRDSYRCQVCFARMDKYQWRIGDWGGISIPVTPVWQNTSETKFCSDFFPTNHNHSWMYAQGSPYYCFGTKWAGCAIGGGRHVSEFCRIYESDPGFRVFIQKKLKDGTLAKSNVIELASVPLAGEPSPFQKEADALIEAYWTSK